MASGCEAASVLDDVSHRVAFIEETQLKTNAKESKSRLHRQEVVCHARTHIIWQPAAETLPFARAMALFGAVGAPAGCHR